MKKWVKVLIPLSAFVVIVCSAVAIWYVRRHHDVYTIHSIRPKDFPEILIVPEQAERVDYSSPSNTHRAPHTYRLSFVKKDPYPSENTLNFIREHLQSNGWQRLKYDLLNPHSPLWQAPFVPEYLDPNTVDILFPKRKQKGNYPVLWRKEDWIKDDENINVALYYSSDLTTKKVNRDRLYVNLSSFGRKSWCAEHTLHF